MEADFSGWATKAGLKCKDGRTIAENAFKHQDTMTVPLVWQHGHSDPENVLGHAILSNRKGGVYCEAFFNDTTKGQHAKKMVAHKDVTMLSIWANDIIERAGTVLHGAIREVSLVLSGANPGALIDNIVVRHSDDGDEVLSDEVIIFTGLSFEHTSVGEQMAEAKLDKQKIVDVYESYSPEQKEFLHSMISDALKGDKKDVEHADKEKTFQDVLDTFDDDQKNLLQFLIGEAAEAKQSGINDDNNDDDDNDDGKNPKGKKVIKHNAFEDAKGKDGGPETVISHDDMQSVLKNAKTLGSMKAAVEAYGIQHSIENIDTLFPEAVAVDNVPEFLQRRVEWVASFMGGVTKSPFARIKTFNADITEEDARAKGYITGTLKKEEFFPVAKRETTPTTVYKKQSLDRDDVIDITDFDVVVWLKAEMRLMLDEEIARAALIGDGRDVSSEDKINEGNIRPIASDHELYTTRININILDASSSIQELIDAVILNRRYYKGTGTPTFYTSETIIARFLLLKDTLNRAIYKDISEVASVLRVKEIVPVEVMEEDESLIGIMVNPVDYRMGASKGGEVNMFDDFDIDYNKQKYLIETRVSGALTKLKSAIAFYQTEAADVLIVPAAPTFDEETGELTINDTANVVYKCTDTNATVTNGASPYTIPSGDSITIQATPAAGYFFASSEDDSWTFTAL